MRRTLSAALVGFVSLGAGACSSSPATTTHGAGTLAGKSPKQILASARTAANSAGSAHVVVTLTSAGQTQTITGDATPTEGRQTITIGDQHIQVVLVGGVAYLQGNASGLRTTLGFPAAVATQFAGKWIAVKNSDGPYRSIVQNVILGSTLAELVPAGPLSLTAPMTVGGRQAVGVRGGLPGTTPSGVTGSTTLYIATSSPTVPLRFTGTARNASQTVTDVGTFTQWGETVTLAAPSGAAPFSSVPTH